MTGDARGGPRPERRHGRGPRAGEERRPRRGPGPWGPFGPDPGGPFGPDEFGPGFGPGLGRGRRGHRARKGDVRMAVVHLLAEQPRNGYQMIQDLAERTDGAWKPSPGAMYPAISQLADEGLIESTVVDGAKAFQLTDAGRRLLSENPEAPWTALTEASADFHGSDAGALWREFGQLAQAAKAVMTGGSAGQLAQATDLLAETKRRLYALLATDPEDQ